MADSKKDFQQGSIVTVFSLWNTLMGTTLLAIPWTLAQAGFTLGIFLIMFMAALCYYTCALVLRLAIAMKKNQLDEKQVEIVEFSDVCRYFVGPKFAKVTVTISIFTLLTAAIAYWILMSDFLFIIGKSISGFVEGGVLISANVSSNATAISVFEQVWTPLFIPLFLAAALYPLTLFRTPTFFTKLNSVGVLSIFYLIALVAVKAGILGVNFNFCQDPTLRDFSSHFPALTGTMTLGFFLHNAVIAMMGPSNPATRVRDLGYGYGLVLITYLYIGITVYIIFPENKGTIRDNFLRNFPNSDILVFVARIGLLFQMTTVFPLLVYIIRLQFVRSLLGRDETLFLWRASVSAGTILLGVLMAIFFPKIGTVLRIAGSLSGLAFAYTLPCVVYLTYLRREGKATHAVVWGHVLIIVFGLFNFLSQFLI